MTLKSMRQGWEVGITQGTYAEGVLPPWLKWGHVGHKSKGDPIRSHSYPARPASAASAAEPTHYKMILFYHGALCAL